VCQNNPDLPHAFYQSDFRLIFGYFFIDLVLPAAATDGRFNPTGRSVDSSHDFGANEMFCVAWFE